MKGDAAQLRGNNGEGVIVWLVAGWGGVVILGERFEVGKGFRGDA